jgi:hypothetical protein
MTDGTKIMADHLQSDEYKQKYDDLMQRCAEFMRDFAPPSPYELGFKAGWEAAKQEFCKDNTYVPDTTKPARTMDLQWPRDNQAWPTIPTTPFPPVNNMCRTCGQDLSKLTQYVCYHPNCHQLFVGPTA